MPYLWRTPVVLDDAVAQLGGLSIAGTADNQATCGRCISDSTESGGMLCPYTTLIRHLRIGGTLAAGIASS